MKNSTNLLSSLVSFVSLFNGLLPALQKFPHDFSEGRAVIRTSLVSLQEPEILRVIKRSSHFRPSTVTSMYECKTTLHNFKRKISVSYCFTDLPKRDQDINENEVADSLDTSKTRYQICADPIGLFPSLYRFIKR